MFSYIILGNLAACGMGQLAQAFSTLCFLTLPQSSMKKMHVAFRRKLTLFRQ